MLKAITVTSFGAFLSIDGDEYPIDSTPPMRLTTAELAVVRAEVSGSLPGYVTAPDDSEPE